MSNVMQLSPIESALILGDLAKLSTDQRLNYYKSVCESVGLNPLTKPFEYINLNGKLTLYAKRDATDQLRKVHKVSITISTRELMGDIYVVTARARDNFGREDESTGAVNISGLKGDALANAYMKAETKAKRRVTLSVCGLGLLDETEVSTIAEATPFSEEPKLEIPDVFRDTDLSETVITFGKYKGKMFKDLDVFALDGYVKWVIQSAKEQNKEITGQVLKFTQDAEAYLVSQEQQGGMT